MSKFNAPIVYNGDFAKVLKSKLKLEENVQIISANVDPTAVATDAPIGSILINQTTGILYKKTDAGSSTNWKRLEQQALEYLGSITKDPTGFPNLTDSTVTFDDANLRITVAPTGSTFRVYHKGSILNLGSINNTWTDTEGLWYAYIDSAGALQVTQTSNHDTMIVDHVFVATWYWDATNNASIYRGEERHGISMDSTTHAYLHNTFGTRYVSGLALNTFTLTSPANTAPVAIAEAEFGVDAGVIMDEDLRHALTAILSTSSKRTFYRLGASGAWRRQVDGSIPTIYDGSTRIQYNQFTGGAWQLTTVPNNNDFMLIHAFATNDLAQPVVFICGQNTYSTAPAARTGATKELNSLLLGGLPFVEFKAIGTVIYQTNSGWSAGFKKCKVIEAISGGADYVDWRVSQVAANLTGVTDHGTLSGLADDDHLQYSLTDGSRAVTGSQTFNSDIKVDTVNETTAAAGVNVDGVLLKDNTTILSDVGSLSSAGAGKIVIGSIGGQLSYYSPVGAATRTVVNMTGSQIIEDKTLRSPKIDTIVEETSGAGITADSVLLKDGSVTVGTGGKIATDTIDEKTAASGVTIDGLLIKDNDISRLFNSLIEDFNISLSASAAAGALTITMYNGAGNSFSATDFGRISFRAGTATSSVANKAIFTSGNKQLVVPSGATLGTNKIIRGTSTAVNSRFYVYAIDTDGTSANVQLGISKYPFNDHRLRSTTAIDTSSDFSNVIYSTSAVTSRPIKMIGVIEIPVATPGTWVNPGFVKTGNYGNLPVEKLVFRCPAKTSLHTHTNNVIETVLYEFAGSSAESFDNMGVQQGTASGVEGITCPVAGHYKVDIAIKYQNISWTAEKLIEQWVNVNGTNITIFEYEIPTTATQEIWVQSSTVVKCASGDLLETRMRQNNTDNKAVSGGYINISLINEEEQ